VSLLWLLWPDFGCSRCLCGACAWMCTPDAPIPAAHPWPGDGGPRWPGRHGPRVCAGLGQGWDRLGQPGDEETPVPGV